MITSGSIIACYTEREIAKGATKRKASALTFSIVDRVENGGVYCADSICSVNGTPFKLTRSLYPEYEGEYLSDVRLITPEEFDMILNSNLISKTKLKNVK